MPKEWKIECLSTARWAVVEKWGWSEHNVHPDELWDLEDAIVQCRNNVNTLRDKMKKFELIYRIYNVKTDESIPLAALGI